MRSVGWILRYTLIGALAISGSMCVGDDKSKFSIGRVQKSPLPDGTTITIYPNAALPPNGELTTDGAWIIDLYGPTRSLAKHIVVAGANVHVDLISGTVIIDTGTPVKPVVQINVAYKGSVVGQWPRLPTPKTFFIGAKSPQDANISITGSYSPAIGSPPQYSIDSSGTLAVPIGKSPRDYLGGAAAVKTDKRAAVNPDSYSAALIYQRVLWSPPLLSDQEVSSYAASSEGPPTRRVEGAVLNWYVSGVEFDHKATNLNYISAAAVSFPVRILPIRPIVNDTKVLSSMTFIGGIETGDNIENAVRRDGLGYILRGYAGADFAGVANVPKSWHLKGITLASSYRVRVPSTSEVFTRTKTNATTGKTVDVPFLSTQARHHLQSELDFNLSDSFSITVKHEYGEMPPAFRLVDNSVTIGLKIALQQRNAVRGGMVSR
jgi:hypothetical protein